jgi:hypothetical protein
MRDMATARLAYIVIAVLDELCTSSSMKPSGGGRLALNRIALRLCDKSPN